MCEEPYARCTDEEAVENFEKGVFPSIEGIPIGKIILDCWQGTYDSAESVHKDILKTELKLRER